MNDVKCLLVGAGDIATRRVTPALVDAPCSELVAVCDVVEERAAALAASYGVGRAYSDYSRALVESEADAVYDSAKVREAVPECVCTTPFPEGLKRTVQFYLDHPEYQKVDAKWDSDFDRIVGRYGA